MLQADSSPGGIQGDLEASVHLPRAQSCSPKWSKKELKKKGVVFLHVLQPVLRSHFICVPWQETGEGACERGLVKGL